MTNGRNYDVSINFVVNRRGTGFTELRRELRNIEENTAKSAKQSGLHWTELKSQIELATGAIKTAGRVIEQTFEFGREGAQLLQLEQSFARANAEIFKTPDLLQQLRTASRGTITDATLMSGVMTLTAGTTEEYGRALAAATPNLVAIAKASNALNPRLGTTEELYDKLSFAIKRTSKLRADDLGLMISMENATRELHPALQAVVDDYEDLDEQQRFLNEALFQGDRLIKQAGGNAQSLTDDWERLATSVAETTDEFKRWLAEALVPVVTGVNEFLTVTREGGEVVEDLAEKNIKAAKSYEDQEDALRRAIEANRLANTVIGSFSGLSDETRDAVIRTAKAIAQSSENYEEFERRLDAAGLSTFELSQLIAAQEGHIRGSAGAVGDSTDEWYEWERTVREANEAAAADVVLLQKLEDQTVHTTKKTKELTEEQIELKEALEEYWLQQKDNLVIQESASRSEELHEKILRKSIMANYDAAAAEEARAKAVEEAAKADEEAQRALYERQAALTEVWVEAATGGIDFFKTSLDDLGPAMVLTGGLTADQNRIYEEAADNYKDVTQELEDYRVGLRGYGLDADELGEKIQELTDEQAYWQSLMGQFSGIQAQANMVIRESQVDVEKVTDAFFAQVQGTIQSADALQGYGISAETAGQKMVDLGLATGKLNEQQAEQIVNAIRLQGAIDTVEQAYLSESISADVATQALASYGEGQFSTIERAIAVAKAHEGSAGALDNYSGSANEAITSTDNLTRKLEEADGTKVETEITTTEKVDKQQAETDLGEFQDKLWQVAKQQEGGAPEPYTIQMESNALKVRDEEIQPLQDSMDATVDNSPYESTMQNNALLKLKEVDEYTAGLNRIPSSKTTVITTEYRTVGSPAGGGPDAGGQRGLDIIVPSGYPRDSYRIGASSGERVLIQTPAQQRASGNGGGFHLHGDINIYASGTEIRNPHLLARRVNNELGDMYRG